MVIEKLHPQKDALGLMVKEKPSLSVVILTYNEEHHIARCIKSLQPFAREIFIVDSFSTDKTIEVAESLGARCYKNAWENNYALQFNWGLLNLPIETDWIMRMDADEYVLPELAEEIIAKLNDLPDDTTGVTVNRRVHFMDRWIRHGGYYPTTLLRIWRKGSGLLEQRWMDEHVKLEYGSTIHFSKDIVDHNLNNLTWWTTKHNNYATREAIDFLIHKHKLVEQDTLTGQVLGAQDKRKRWFKEQIYFKTPLFIRPFFYFLFRYFIKLGFLDGTPGIVWHFLQGFWYRFLVDAKVYELYKKGGKDKESLRRLIFEEYKLKV